MPDTALAFHPLTPERWPDFEKLLGRGKACSGCWCMWWKLKRKDFESARGKQNKHSQKKLVNSGTIPGVLAFLGTHAVGWAAVEPRACYPLLARSPLTKPIDDQPVWSITCLYVDENHRGTRLTSELVTAAVDHVRKSGGRIVESYAVEPQQGEELPAAWISTGVPSIFAKAGFTQVSRRPSTRDRLIYRYRIR